MRNDNRNINVVKPCIGHLIGLPYNELSSKKSLTVAFLTVVILPIRNDNSSQLKDVCLKLIREVATFSHVKLLPESWKVQCFTLCQARRCLYNVYENFYRENCHVTKFSNLSIVMKRKLYSKAFYSVQFIFSVQVLTHSYILLVTSYILKLGTISHSERWHYMLERDNIITGQMTSKTCNSWDVFVTQHNEQATCKRCCLWQAHKPSSSAHACTISTMPGAVRFIGFEQ